MTLWARPQKRWSRTGSSLYGAMLGMVLVLIHEAYAIYTNNLLNENPFVHVMAEMAIVAAGGAMLFASRPGSSTGAPSSLIGTTAV